MSTKLQITVCQDDQTVTSLMTGPMDAHADYSVIPVVGVRQLNLDFSGITLIDSVGIQNWLKFATSIPAAVAVEFHKCPVRVISQLNLFQGFSGNRPVKIRSFFAPYYCDGCDESRDYILEIEASGLSAANLRAPAKDCATCHAAMEFDGIEKKYFQFLTY